MPTVQWNLGEISLPHNGIEKDVDSLKAPPRPIQYVSSSSSDLSSETFEKTKRHQRRGFRFACKRSELHTQQSIEHMMAKERTFVVQNGIPATLSETSFGSFSTEAQKLHRKYPYPGTPPLPRIRPHQRPLATRGSPRRVRESDEDIAGRFFEDKQFGDEYGLALPSPDIRTHMRQRRRRRKYYDAEFPLGEVSTDKPVASQAVAFVIRASRHGVVPLCAEVANLFKENSNLAEAVGQQNEELSQLKQEVEVLRAAARGPPPVMKDFCLQTVQETDCQTMTTDESSAQTETTFIPCLREENYNDLRRDRPLSSRASRFPSLRNDSNGTAVGCPGVKAKCGNDVIVTCSCRPLMTTATQNPIMISMGVNTVDEDCMDSALGYFEHTSLEKTHKELAQKHSEVVEKNDDMGKLNEELDTNLKNAKGEIVTLQKAIQEMQNKEYERAKEEEKLQYEDTYSVDVQKTWTSGDEETVAKARQQKTTPEAEPLSRLLPMLTADTPTSSRTRTAASRSSIFPGPILGCKCQMCTAFFRSSGILGFACSPYVTDSSGRNPVLRDLRKLVWLQNSKLQIQPKDQVIARNNRLGTVRYVGHLDGVGTPSVVYIGLELENQDGLHDGYLHGKRYFFCAHRHGLFIPLQDVICVINRKVSPPSAHPPVRKRQPAITGLDSRGRITNMSVSEIRRRRKMQSSSDTGSDSSAMTSETSSASTLRSDKNDGGRFPTLTVK